MSQIPMFTAQSGPMSISLVALSTKEFTIVKTPLQDCRRSLTGLLSPLLSSSDAITEITQRKPNCNRKTNSKSLFVPGTEKIESTSIRLSLPALFSLSNPTPLWNPPPFGFLKCNIDAALHADSVGFWAVIRNNEGNFVAAYGGVFPYSSFHVVGDDFLWIISRKHSVYHIAHSFKFLPFVSIAPSGGSAAAVSARQCTVSLGSDTGGSVRQPASFCGVVGLKPTYGRVSRYGLVAYASSLDVIGCFGSSVADAGLLLHAISGHDKFDATSSKREIPDFTSQFISQDNLESKPLKGLRVGVIRETIEEGVDPEVISSIRGAASHLEELGCTVTEVSLPSFSLGLPAYYILASSESSSNLSRYDSIRYGNQVVADELNSLYGGSRAKGFGSEVKMRILMGTYALSAGYYDAYYKRAQQVRALVRESFREALENNDILISPAAPSAAYKIGEKKDDPLAMYAGDIMTVNVNLAGLPALVLPCGFVDGGSVGLPVGVQMIGAAFDEGKLLRMGHIFEQTLQGCSFIPPLVADEFSS
nr:glutamyl-tRNA(Gln) amidotransferase subunit A, chloroplastic/mitochondrial [Ipomoea batatas]